MHIDNWEFYASPLRKKTYVLSLGMPPFIGSKYIRKKMPVKTVFVEDIM